MSPKYPYAKGALLDDRNTYFYSTYGGSDFLQAWASDRDNALTITASPPPGDAIEVPDLGRPVLTATLLESLINAMANNTPPNARARAWLSKLVQKFEVTKRVHEAYDDNFKAVERKNHRDLALYLRLAEVFEQAFSTTNMLPYLNALLKVLDTLCALRVGLSKSDRARLSNLIVRERTHVIALAERSGVAFIA
jgi:hypothetical protein